MSSDDEFATFMEQSGDDARDALALCKAVFRGDADGADSILAQADMRRLAWALATLTEQCAIQGAISGGKLTEQSTRNELLAARDEVLEKITQSYRSLGWL